MATRLDILTIDCSPAVASLLAVELRAGGFDPTCEDIGAPANLCVALEHRACDLLIACHQASASDIQSILSVLEDCGIDVPIIVVTDAAHEDVAVNLMQLGAHDYVIESSPKRLLPAVQRRLLEAEARRERARAMRPLQEAKPRLQLLSAGMMNLQEAERRRIALELHDQVGQALTAIKIHLEALKNTPAAAPMAQPLEDSLPVVERAIQDVRSLCMNLRPPQLDDLGLVPALRSLLAEQAQLSGWRAQFHTGLPGARWDPRIETACFRVAQEALTNIARHGEASEVTMELDQRGVELHLFVRDDGIGFDMTSMRRRALKGRSLGLTGMEERVENAAGQLSWKSRPTGGMELHVVLPLVIRPEFRRRWRDHLEAKFL